jgi:hypothetical protein
VFRFTGIRPLLPASGVAFGDRRALPAGSHFETFRFVPWLTAQITGGTPRSAGIFYDVSYDRALSPPAKTTPYGIVGGANLCPSVVGTQVGFDEEIDYNYLDLHSGKPDGSSGINGINPDYLPRDPKNGCAPVYPHTYIRDNTIFNVAHNAVCTRRGPTSTRLMTSPTDRAAMA